MSYQTNKVHLYKLYPGRHSIKNTSQNSLNKKIKKQTANICSSISHFQTVHAHNVLFFILLHCNPLRSMKSFYHCCHFQFFICA